MRERDIGFIDAHGMHIPWLRFKPQRSLLTSCCHNWRWAKYLRAQLCYDCVKFFCANGHGCRQNVEQGGGRGRSAA
jgi:hypothetical protein